jgi:uncharacterized protein (DUF1015 family)
MRRLRAGLRTRGRACFSRDYVRRTRLRRPPGTKDNGPPIMAEIQPFAATRYSKEYEPELDRLLTPPYDVISPEMQQEFYKRHSRNLVRIDFGKERLSDGKGQDKYTRAADLFDMWKREGVLERDPRPAIYVYEQEFDLPGRGRRRRRGFFCAVRLEGLEEGIRAHERTFEGPKADRLKLTRATNANISPIFCVYQDETRDSDRILAESVAGKTPVECTIDGIVHRLWIVDDPRAVGDLRQVMHDKRLFIADGHHRYETALNYRAERRAAEGVQGSNAAYESTLMFLANTYDEGLEILPTHRVLTPELSAGIDTARVVTQLREHFDVIDLETPENPAEAAPVIARALGEAGERAPSFALLLGRRRTLLASLKPGSDPAALIPAEDIPVEVKRLDVTLLHRYLIGRLWLGEGAPEPGHDDILYIKDAAEAVAMVRTGGYEAGFLLNPTKMDQVCEIAGLGVRMPQKSTYFYPKIITGMVIRDMSED